MAGTVCLAANDLPSIHLDNLPCDVGTLIAGQVRSHAGYFLRPCHAAERNGLDDLLGRLRPPLVEGLAGLVGIGQADSYGIGPDAGTSFLADIEPGPGSGDPQGFTLCFDGTKVRTGDRVSNRP